MRPDQLSKENYCQLARAVLEYFGGFYAQAIETLGQFRLNLICGEEITRSAALQAALLTAVNTGKRAFLGGVSVEMPPHVELLLSWPGAGPLNEIVESLGARCARANHCDRSHTLYFGTAADPVPDALSVICSGWRGGVAPAELSFSLDDSIDFALGGVLAGALGVARGFLRVCGLNGRFVERPLGVSLWRPDLEWTDEHAAGPELKYLPSKLWFLGLGHLGQAFLWNTVLLPYERPGDALFLLQDFDRVVSGNWTAGLLCEKNSSGRFKTRLCSEWLEALGPGLNLRLNIAQAALVLMVATVLLPAFRFSMLLQSPTPAQLLVAICIGIFSSVVCLWILDAVSIVQFRSEWVSKSVWGAAILSILGTGVGVFQGAFSERKYQFEGAWNFRVLARMADKGF